jgi:hypothetical protein
MCVAFVFGMLNAAPGLAAPPDSSATSSDGWHFLISPYFMFPHMSGSATVKGVPADVSESPSDIFSKLKFGGMLYIEAHNAKWALSVDGIYMDLGQSGTTPLGTYDVGVTQSAVMLNGYRRLDEWVEVFLNATFNSIGGSLKGAGPVGTNIDQTKSWVDPYIGIRLRSSGPSKWHGTLTGSVGGFNVGSKFAWQVYPEVSYRFTPLFEINGGYRAMAMDYVTGSGTSKFKYDITTFGPQLGFGFHF